MEGPNTWKCQPDPPNDHTLISSQSVRANPTSDPKSHATEVGPKCLNIGLSHLIVKVLVTQQKLTDTSSFLFGKSWPYHQRLGPQLVRNQ